VPAAVREGARNRLVVPASAGRLGDGTSGQLERSASAIDQRHVCAGPASIPVIKCGAATCRSAPSGLTAIRDERNALMFLHKSTKVLAVIAAAIVIGGGAYGIVSATASSGSATTTAATSASTSSGQPMARGGGSNARSKPAAGGVSGTIASVSTSSFTLTTSAGQKVTITTTSSTEYPNGASLTSANAISKGESVLVLGTVNGTTITASQVLMQPTTGAGSATPSATAVVPFQRGAPSTSKQVGQIPASYSQGSGTIESGTTANTATEAALGAYPGGIVDRVVKLSNGQYEVHNIGVNWPHHIFVNQSFKVVGAD
jgi:Domain of unknown function (DUF5666)